MSTGNRIRRAAMSAILAAGSAAAPLAALHPGHEHAGLFGGTFHVVVQWAALPLLLTSIGIVLYVRRRAPR